MPQLYRRAHVLSSNVCWFHWNHGWHSAKPNSLSSSVTPQVFRACLCLCLCGQCTNTLTCSPSSSSRLRVYVNLPGSFPGLERKGQDLQCVCVYLFMDVCVYTHLYIQMLFYVYVFVFECMYVHHVCAYRDRRGNRFPWNWSYSQL